MCWSVGRRMTRGFNIFISGLKANQTKHKILTILFTFIITPFFEKSQLFLLISSQNEKNKHLIMINNFILLLFE